MTYRKPTRSAGRNIQLPQVVPKWTTAHSDTVTLVARELMANLGITNASSYFHILRTPIAISVIVCACIGASIYGLKGLLLGGLLGVIAPIALIWLCVLLIGLAIFMAVYVAAWAVILYLVWWLLHS
jgi:hypothetical protein